MNLNVFFQILVCTAGVLVYSDSLFITYFNSFYQEPVFLITLLLCIAVLIRNTSESIMQELLIFSLSVSKFQNVVFSVFYAFPFFSNQRRTKVIVILIALSLLMVGLGSPRYRPQNLFHSFFTGLLMHNSDKERVLADFGLKRPEYTNLIGKN